ncbi:hypothetical protein ACFL2X_05795 [Candidatus Latescibacterota bacterium]
MKKAAFFLLLMIIVKALSQFIVEAEDTYSYNADIKSLIDAKGCPECHSFTGSYSEITSKRVRMGSTYYNLVTPAKPDSSAIIWRIEGKDASGTGIEKMPQGGPYYTDAEIAIFRAWITQGVLEESPVGVDDTHSWMEIKSKFK